MAVSPAALSYEQPPKYFSFRSGNFWVKNIFFSFNNFQSFSKIVQKTFLGKTGFEKGGKLCFFSSKGFRVSFPLFELTQTTESNK